MLAFLVSWLRVVPVIGHVQFPKNDRPRLKPNRRTTLVHKSLGGQGRDLPPFNGTTSGESALPADCCSDTHLCLGLGVAVGFGVG